jgi:hypothetical protein
VGQTPLKPAGAPAEPGAPSSPTPAPTPESGTTPSGPDSDRAG